MFLPREPEDTLGGCSGEGLYRPDLDILEQEAKIRKASSKTLCIVIA